MGQKRQNGSQNNVVKAPPLLYVCDIDTDTKLWDFNHDVWLFWGLFKKEKSFSRCWFILPCWWKKMNHPANLTVLAPWYFENDLENNLRNYVNRIAAD